MKYLFLVYYSLLSFSYVYGQGDNNFIENAFLDYRYFNPAYIYSDSVSNKILYKIQNKNTTDKYFLFQLFKVYKGRAKVAAKYTIDAAVNDSSVYTGWVDLKNVKVIAHYQKNESPFFYLKSNRNAQKYFIDKKIVEYPLQIIDIVLKEGNLWLKVIVRDKKGKSYQGWLSPELQCTDIWNACSGN
jgi:hypothetical protein